MGTFSLEPGHVIKQLLRCLLSMHYVVTSTNIDSLVDHLLLPNNCTTQKTRREREGEK